MNIPLLIIVLILFLTALGPTLYLAIKRIRLNIHRRKLEPWYNNIIPERILKNIPKDNNIIYNSGLIKNTKSLIFYVLAMNLGIICFCIVIIPFIWNYAPDDFGAPIKPILIVICIACPIMSFWIYVSEKKKNYIVLTENRLYKYERGFSRENESAHYRNLSEMQAVVFKKRFLDKRNAGTAELITKDSIPRRYSIYNIPNILKFQQVLESIFYEY